MVGKPVRKGKKNQRVPDCNVGVGEKGGPLRDGFVRNQGIKRVGKLNLPRATRERIDFAGKEN